MFSDFRISRIICWEELVGPEWGRSWVPISEPSCLQFLHHWIVCLFFAMLGLASNILSLI